MASDLKKICENAITEGLKIDLTGCFYGEPHWDDEDDFIAYPFHYYYFVAGFVRTQGLTSILEIGTHYGGTIMAMSRGLSDGSRERNLVTVDVTYENEEGFKDYPHIRRIKGNSLNEETANHIFRCFRDPIDLLYIDATHDYEETKRNVQLFGEKLNPKYLLLDDIQLNAGMKRLWSELTAQFGERAFDASDIARAVKDVGFGAIAWSS